MASRVPYRQHARSTPNGIERPRAVGPLVGGPAAESSGGSLLRRCTASLPSQQSQCSAETPP